MGPLETWEQVLLGVFVVLLLLWLVPGAKRAIEQSREAERDWPAVLLPIALVILFVLFLIALV